MLSSNSIFGSLLKCIFFRLQFPISTESRRLEVHYRLAHSEGRNPKKVLKFNVKSKYCFYVKSKYCFFLRENTCREKHFGWFLFRFFIGTIFSFLKHCSSPIFRYYVKKLPRESNFYKEGIWNWLTYLGFDYKKFILILSEKSSPIILFNKALLRSKGFLCLMKCSSNRRSKFCHTYSKPHLPSWFIFISYNCHWHI